MKMYAFYKKDLFLDKIINLINNLILFLFKVIVEAKNAFFFYNNALIQ